MTANREGSVCPVPDRAPPTPVSIRRPLLDVKIHVCFSEAPLLFTLLSGFIHISSLPMSLAPLQSPRKGLYLGDPPQPTHLTMRCHI